MERMEEVNKKIELMYELFGKKDGKRCGECSNLICGRYHDRILRKCEAYGLTHSEASDWVKRWEACGLFNAEYTGRQVIEIAKRRNYENKARDKRNMEIVDGQISMDFEV